MYRLIRCRRCGALFVPDQWSRLVPWRRLCPRCRGPLPPTGGVLAMEDWVFHPAPLEVAS